MFFVILLGSFSFGIDGSFFLICVRFGVVGILLEMLEREIRVSREKVKRVRVSCLVVILGIGCLRIMYCFGIVCCEF